MKHTPYLNRNINSGTQKLYRFDNGYGASVVQSPYSYGGKEGKFELAVIAFDGDDWRLIYNTPITDDVLGYLTEDEIESTLDAIQALPKAEATNA